MDKHVELYNSCQNSNEAISQIIEEWLKVKVVLEELYRNRDQINTLVSMKKGIELFLQFVFWTNEKQVILQEPIPWNHIEYKPVNIEERFEFIMSRPNLFHSFRQLSELMVEQEKQYMKKNIMKKASKPNG
ncbi:YpoC family protein [Neobacillus ginsengisoli]|uniref:YpoC-like domain-containing protein n=1 Tax=Neobacillus ginsengisoli TaxID=904295 RepID=A0ABT9XPT8_9BACI|nr:hypothetical protein [Neobacillus ginsengisoli]MDQ0197544.1 hypothetical protein [Neobacillus ginsengisoli]